MSHHQFVTRYWILAISTNYGCECNGDFATTIRLQRTIEEAASTVPILEWLKAALDQWTLAAGIREGRIFRAVARTGKVWRKGISQNVVWYVVKTCCERAGLEHIAPHDLRRTCAKLCHISGGELEPQEIQILASLCN